MMRPEAQKTLEGVKGPEAAAGVGQPEGPGPFNKEWMEAISRPARPDTDR